MQLPATGTEIPKAPSAAARRWDQQTRHCPDSAFGGSKFMNKDAFRCGYCGETLIIVSRNADGGATLLQGGCQPKRADDCPKDIIKSVSKMSPETKEAIEAFYQRSIDLAKVRP